MIGSTGWTAAVLTPGTNTTGDVRGVANLSTVVVGVATGTSAGGVLDGVKRVTIFQTVSFYGAIAGTPTNYTSLIGVAQATA